MELLSNSETKYHCLGVFDQDELVGSHFLEIYKLRIKKPVTSTDFG
jgi:hypothetical protein